MVDLRCFDHLLDIFPVHLLLSKALYLFLLSLGVFEEEDTDQEVEEEEGSYQDEKYEEVTIEDLIFELWALVNSSRIKCLVHDIRPPF